VHNHHKPFLESQLEDLRMLNEKMRNDLISTIAVFKTLSNTDAVKALEDSAPFVKQIREIRKREIKRVKNKEVSTRNSMLFLNLIGELRNLVLFSDRIVRVCQDLVINTEEE